MRDPRNRRVSGWRVSDPPGLTPRRTLTFGARSCPAGPGRAALHALRRSAALAAYHSARGPHVRERGACGAGGPAARPRRALPLGRSAGLHADARPAPRRHPHHAALGAARAHLPQSHAAVILSEDGGFCRHGGVDWGELKEAIESANDGIARGGSTISMQVVKNLFLWPSRELRPQGPRDPAGLCDRGGLAQAAHPRDLPQHR